MGDEEHIEKAKAALCKLQMLRKLYKRLGLTGGPSDRYKLLGLKVGKLGLDPTLQLTGSELEAIAEGRLGPIELDPEPPASAPQPPQAAMRGRRGRKPNLNRRQRIAEVLRLYDPWRGRLPEVIKCLDDRHIPRPEKNEKGKPREWYESWAAYSEHCAEDLLTENALEKALEKYESI